MERHVPSETLRPGVGGKRLRKTQKSQALPDLGLMCPICPTSWPIQPQAVGGGGKGGGGLRWGKPQRGLAPTKHPDLRVGDLYRENILFLQLAGSFCLGGGCEEWMVWHRLPSLKAASIKFFGEKGRSWCLRFGVRGQRVPRKLGESPFGEAPRDC